jgi:hypothetical protein
MKYLKYFKDASDYEAYKNGSDYVLPNVSYVENSNVVMYNPKEMLPSEDDVFYLANGTNNNRFCYNLSTKEFDGNGLNLREDDMIYLGNPYQAVYSALGTEFAYISVYPTEYEYEVLGVYNGEIQENWSNSKYRVTFDNVTYDEFMSSPEQYKTDVKIPNSSIYYDGIVFRVNNLKTKSKYDIRINRM